MRHRQKSGKKIMFSHDFLFIGKIINVFEEIKLYFAAFLYSNFSLFDFRLVLEI